jgi:hypothetical protein
MIAFNGIALHGDTDMTTLPDFQRSSSLADAAELVSEHVAPDPHQRRVIQTPEQRMPGWERVRDLAADEFSADEDESCDSNRWA